MQILQRLIILIVLIGAPASTALASKHEIAGWYEIVLTVRQISDYDEFLSEIAKWQTLESGEVSQAQLRAWGLPAEAKARFRLVNNPGSVRGNVRLVEFSGVAQTYNRIDEQSWDTGGIFNFNVRVKNLQETAQRMRALGWQSRADITQFEFGQFEVKEWIVRSPDGVQIAFIERLKPELTDWPHLKAVSRPFNSTQMVKNMRLSLAFYEDVLGFKRVIEHKAASKEQTPNVLGIPINLTTEIVREVYVLQPLGVNDGSVEILQYFGLQGADHSETAHFPNLGISLLRFPVRNLNALEQHLKKNDVSFVHSASVIDGVNRLTVSTEDGAWLEFYETDKPISVQ